MTEAIPPSQPRPLVIEQGLAANPKLRLHPSSAASLSVSGPRSGHLNLDTFSPVNQDGSFAFDRVLRSGEVHKRTRKTKQWKKIYLVLRPNLLSVYKSASEERLHKQISLSEITAVAYLKDPKGRREHMFNLYSPSQNYHLQARDEQDLRAWVALIRREARIDEEEQEMYYGSPTQERPSQDRLGSSSPEPLDAPPRPSFTRDGIRIPGIQQISTTHDLDYSGDDQGAYSDWSDTPLPPPQQLSSSLPTTDSKMTRRSILPTLGPGPIPAPASASALTMHTSTARNASPSSGFQIQDDERVIWHGHLLYLRSHGGVRQWKRLWVVLRPKNLAFYKDADEYAARLIMPLASIISAVEIDPVSRSKRHCMQIIAEERSYRFCAPSEEALAKWLGALKSQLARKKEAWKNAAL
ncbi:MAG: hypothetical protein Q9214_002389 [Letrouitia sp. 1 TL-2023]